MVIARIRERNLQQLRPIMQPAGVADGRLPVWCPRMAGSRGACVAFDDVVVVVALLGKLPSVPPNPTARATMAAPPNSEIAFVASDFIRIEILHRVVVAGATGPPPDKDWAR